ncbi:hypothetical protein Avbf_13497 [Armadillidium vulgare]|nr:hypothetical protein Avbf_13497 [Armadillidium vulgare]
MKREFKKKIQTDFLLNLFHHVVKRVTSTGGHLNQLTLSYLNIEGRHTCIWGDCGGSQFSTSFFLFTYRLMLTCSCLG